MAHYVGDSMLADLNAGSFFVQAAINVTTGETSCSSTSCTSAWPGATVAASSVTEVHIESSHGKLAALITLSSPVSIAFPAGTVSVATFEVQLLRFRVASGGAQLWPDTSNMMRAGWNLFMLNNDGSHGAHNPRFFNAIIGDTLAADLTVR